MSLSFLRCYVKQLLHEAKMFEQWLSPDVVNLLINEYADKDPTFGVLNWKYDDRLSNRVWGVYSPSKRMLSVNKIKTKNLFKEQINTILHEIQHWNQHIKVASDNPLEPSKAWKEAYSAESRLHGYTNNKFEINARQVADLYTDDAMEKISRYYGGKIDTGNLDDVIEELMNDFIDNDEKPLTRAQIGLALRDRDLNTPENLKAVINELLGLGVKIR